MALSNRWPWFFDDRNEDLFRAFAPLFRAAGERPAAGVFPPVNVFDDGGSFLVRAELPGVNKDSLEVTAKGDQLTVSGERVAQPVKPEASYHRRERASGKFRRTVTLPQQVDPDAVQAAYRNGVLEVVLPRVAESQPRKIAIN
jgi:HSP20 family protein